MSIKDDASRSGTSPNFSQSSALLSSEYGKSLDEKLIATDQFYAFHELFQFCAFSYVQFLNIIESKLNSDTTLYTSSEQIEDQPNMLYQQRTLDVHVERLKGMIAAIQRHSCLREQPLTTSTIVSPQQQAAKSILTDFQHLLMRAERMSSQCQSQTTLLMNQAMIAESSKAIKQAKEVTKLTRLAFVFIPLGFTASICGMNLRPFTKDGSPLWIWIAISAPILLLSFLLMSFDVGKMMRGSQEFIACLMSRFD